MKREIDEKCTHMWHQFEPFYESHLQDLPLTIYLKNLHELNQRGELWQELERKTADKKERFQYYGEIYMEYWPVMIHIRYI